MLIPSDVWGCILEYIQNYKDLCSARLSCKAFLKHLPEKAFLRCVHWEFYTKEDVQNRGYDNVPWKKSKEFPVDALVARQMLDKKIRWDVHIQHGFENYVTKYEKNKAIRYSGNESSGSMEIYENGAIFSKYKWYLPSDIFTYETFGKTYTKTTYKGPYTTYRDKHSVTQWKSENGEDILTSRVLLDITGQDKITNNSNPQPGEISIDQIIPDPEDRERMDYWPYHHSHLGKITRVYPYVQIQEYPGGGKLKVSTFHKNGKLKSVKNYLLGKPHGFHAVWSRSGQLLYKAIFRYNEKLSEVHYNNKQQSITSLMQYSL